MRKLRAFKLTSAEIVAISISLLALASSVWAVMATREATLQARRSEVRSTLQATIGFSQTTYASSVCVLRVAKQFPEARQLEESYERSAQILDEIRGTSDLIQGASHERLDGLEAHLDKMHGVFRRMHDSTVAFKALLSKDELERISNICGAEG